VLIGSAALAETVLYFSSPRLEPKTLVVALALAASGSLLLVGLWTEVASGVFAFTMAIIAASWVGRPAANAIHAPLVAAYSILIAIAIAMLGPGSLSLDYWFFGPREIIIPPANRQSE